MATVFFLILGILVTLSAIYDFMGPAALKADMVRFGYRPGFEKILGVIKIAGAWGLFWGLATHLMGVTASLAFVVYFALAIRVHKKVNDPLAKAMPAVVFLGISIASLVAGLMSL